MSIRPAFNFSTPRHRGRLAVLAAVIVFSALPAAPARADLLTNVSTSFFVNGLGGVSALDQQVSATGPMQADVSAGAILQYPFGTLPQLLDVTMLGRAQARTDYGVNGASIKMGLAATSGTDRGMFQTGLADNLVLNSSLAPQLLAESRWRDTFTVTGGSGVGTATVSIVLRGTVASGYGDTGTLWYDNSATLEQLGRSGTGQVEYRLEVDYVGDPFGFGSDGPPLVIREQPDASNPLPDSVAILGPGTTLTGTLQFLYDQPFTLISQLSLSGQNLVDFDFLHTATLSLFDLPDGASLTSTSGHSYPTELATSVPAPGTLALIAVALAGLGFRRGQRRRPPRITHSGPA